MKSENIFRNVIKAVVAHPAAFFITSILLTALSIIVLITKFDIKSDLKNLMPEHAQSVVDTFTISDRVGSISSLKVIVEMPEIHEITEAQRQSEAYQRCIRDITMNDGYIPEEIPIGNHWCDSTLVLFGNDFVNRIRQLDSVGNVSFFNDKSFFEHNILLYAGVDDLEKAYDEIDATLTEARRQSGEYKACLMTEGDEAACAHLMPGLKSKADEVSDSNKDSLEDELLARYKASELAEIDTIPIDHLGDGSWILRLDIRFKDATTSLSAVKKEVKKIDEIVAELDMTGTYDKDLKIVYTGGLDDMKSEYNAIITDITRSILITIFSILALISIFFKSPRAAVRIFTPLIMSTLWSLAITFLTVGYLNIITAFIFAILIGLGIDFGIHLYARFNRERSAGKSIEEAIELAVVETGTPIFFGALTTSAVFFSLMLGSFRGFTEFGFVAGIGVLLAFLTMCTVLPSMILLVEPRWASKVRLTGKANALPQNITKRVTPLVFAVSLLSLGFCIYSATCIPNILFEENFYRLSMRSDPKAQQGIDKSVRYRKNFSRPTSPSYALLNNTDQVSALDMILKRDREYSNFQFYRRVQQKTNHTLSFIDRYVGEALPYSGQSRSIPIYAMLSSIIPHEGVSYLPLYATYGSHKTAVVRKARAFATTYPNSANWLSETLGEVLEENRLYDALPAIARQQQWLPKSMWNALPKMRGSDQYNCITNFASIFSFLPGTESQQQDKLEWIAKIGERTSDRNIRFLPTEEKTKIKEFRDKYIVNQALSIDDLPEWVKLQFKENGYKPLPPRPDSGVDYAFGNIAVLYQSTSTYDGAQAHMLTHEVRSIRVGDDRVIASTSAFIYSDMLDLVKTDGVRTSAFALILILLIVLLQQRNLVHALIVALPVCLGLGTTIAVMTWFSLKLGLFNIVMLPVILGIGIDGSIYLFGRYQALGKGSVLEAMRQVGGPVFMSSATTVVGFGGMMFSQHMGLNSMGQLAAIGISICFCATFLIEPGLIIICERIGVKSLTKNEYQPDSTDSPAEADSPTEAS